MNIFTVHLNDTDDIIGSFEKGKNILNGPSLTTYELKINNCFLHFVFDSTVFKHDINPRNKLFLRLTDNYLNKYKNLINKIQSNLKFNVKDEDTVFYGKSNYLTPRITGGTVNDKKQIFTNFYKLINDKSIKITVNEIPQQFKGLFTIKIRAVADESNYYYLILEVVDVLITDVIKRTVNKNVPLSYKYLNYKTNKKDS
jgi:alpha-amylase/alpha-mannosidase (GH57 family)